MKTFAEIQAEFNDRLPWMTRMARACFSSLAAAAKEEAIQNTLALCWLRWTQLYAAGRSDVDVKNVLWFSVQQTKAGRQPHDQGRKHDALDHTEGPNVYVVASRNDSIPDVVQTSVDFESFTQSRLSSRDREVLQDILFSDLSNQEIARKWALTSGRVSQLRREIVTEYRKYVGD